MVLILVAGALFVLFIWNIFLTFRFRKLRRQQNLFVGEVKEGNLAEVMAGYVEEEKALEKKLQALNEKQKETAEILTGAIQKMAVVRFDAFEDVGGKLSFSAALLNEHGDGVVISAINGRQESRTYAKLVKKGASSYNLSTEEEEAIARAREYSP